MTDSLADELVRVVGVAAAALRTIDEAAVSAKQKPDGWSIKEIVGHLIDSAANNHQRFVRAQQVSEFLFPGYEQDVWVRSQDHQSRPWTELVDFWVLYNQHLAHVIRKIPQSAASVSCRIGTDETVPLQSLVEDYVVHLRHHLEQIKERRSAEQLM